MGFFMNTKQIAVAKKIICATIALFGILTLLFSLLTIDIGNESYSETGFAFISFNSRFVNSIEEYQWLTTFLGICSIIELIAAIAMIFLAFYSFVKKDAEDFEKIIIIVVLLISILYTVEGIIFKSLVSNVVGEGIDTYIETASFVPLIINCVLTASYIFVNAVFSNENNSTPLEESDKKENEEEKEEKTEKKEKQNDIHNASNAIELLKQYKELFDMGIITQEEFEEKKKQLL